MAEIDSLEISIQSSAKKVDNSIDKLAEQLENLAVSISKIDEHKMHNMATAIKSISDASIGFKKGKSTEIRSLATELGAFGKLRTDSLYSASNAIDGLADGMKKISSISVDAENIKDTANALKQIGNIKETNSVKSVSKLLESLTKLEGISDIKIPKIDTSNIDNVKNAIDKLSEIDTNKINEVAKNIKNISAISKGMKSVEGAKKVKLNIETDIDSGEIEKEIESLKKHLESLYAEEDKAKKALFSGENVDGDIFIELQKQITDTSNQIETFESKLEKIKSKGSEMTIQRGTQETSLDYYTKEFSGIEKEIDRIIKKFGELNNIPKGEFDTVIENLKTDIADLKVEFPKATDTISDFEKKLQEVEKIAGSLTKEPIDFKVNTSISGNSKNATKEIEDSAKSAQQAISKLQEKFSQLEIPVIRETNLDKLNQKLQKTEENIEKLYIELNNKKVTGDINFDVDDKGFEKLIQKITIAEKEADALRSRIEEISKTSPDKTVEGIEDISKSVKNASLSAEQFGEYLKNLKIPEISETNLKKLQSELKNTEKQLDSLKAKAENWTAKGINPNSTPFRNLQEQIVATSKKSDALKKKIKEVAETKPNVSGWQKLTALATLIDKSFSAIKRGVSSAVSSIKKLGKGFSSLYSVVKKVSSAIGKMFSSITQLASKATSAVASSVKGMTSAFSKLRGESSGLQKASSGISGLVKAAGSLLAVKGLVDFGKEAVELGSDITEVENVVDAAFGSMADKAYDFAENAASQFGLSELAAKKYSGTMMAMLKSSNVAQDAAAEMSINLAGLAGDLASFYNIDTDTAFQKLRAGISGETEPLKQLGINMNIVNLETYAMSQGITKAYQEMTLAEQTILRYNYILAKTGDAQGDFARTTG